LWTEAGVYIRIPLLLLAEAGVYIRIPLLLWTEADE
jgi:hypothetical protein